MDERGAVVMKTSVHGRKCAPVCQSYSKYNVVYAIEITKPSRMGNYTRQGRSTSCIEATTTITTLYMAIVSTDGLITSPRTNAIDLTVAFPSSALYHISWTENIRSRDESFAFAFPARCSWPTKTLFPIQRSMNHRAIQFKNFTNEIDAFRWIFYTLASANLNEVEISIGEAAGRQPGWCYRQEWRWTRMQTQKEFHIVTLAGVWR